MIPQPPKPLSCFTSAGSRGGSMATAAAAAEGRTAAGFAAGFIRPLLVTARGRAPRPMGPGTTGAVGSGTAVGRRPGGRRPGRGNLKVIADADSKLGMEYRTSHKVWHC